MMAVVLFTGVDWLVLIGYFVGILLIGFYFWQRNNSSDQFTSGGRSLQARRRHRPAGDFDPPRGFFYAYAPGRACDD